MAIKLGYAIHFVADMNRAVAFYRDTVGLELKFSSPEWSEFATGTTTLALHPASAENPAHRVCFLRPTAGGSARDSRKRCRMRDSRGYALGAM